MASVPTPGGASAGDFLGGSAGGLQKYDPQGIGMSLLGNALSGMAKLMLGGDDQYVDRTPRRLEISDRPRREKFGISDMLYALSKTSY